MGLYGACVEANPISRFAALGQEYLAVEMAAVLRQNERGGAATLMINLCVNRDPREKRTEGTGRQRCDGGVVLIIAVAALAEIPNHGHRRAGMVICVQEGLLMGKQACE